MLEGTDPVLFMLCSFPLAISHLEHQFQFEKAGFNSIASPRLDSKQTLRRYTKNYIAICLHSAYAAAR